MFPLDFSKSLSRSQIQALPLTLIVCRVQYVTDPNKTIADNQWVNKWPSYFTGQVSRWAKFAVKKNSIMGLFWSSFATQIKPTCQPLGIDINTSTSSRYMKGFPGMDSFSRRNIHQSDGAHLHPHKCLADTDQRHARIAHVISDLSQQSNPKLRNRRCAGRFGIWRSFRIAIRVQYVGSECSCRLAQSAKGTPKTAN